MTTEIVPKDMPITALAAINREEIDIQISTAKKYPRDLAKFQTQAGAMVTVTPEFAAKCIYALPRGGKLIIGPSVRFAEVLAHTWGNCRVGARVITEEATRVTAQGVCFDLETNVAITFEVRRRITDRDGNRYNDDMITTTGNAAAAIALRNSILRVIPRAAWGGLYDKVIDMVGDPRDLEHRRTKGLEVLDRKYSLKPEQVCRILRVNSINDIGVEQFVQMSAIWTALEDGEYTVEELLKRSRPIVSQPRRKSDTEAAERETNAPEAAPAPNVSERSSKSSSGKTNVNRRRAARSKPADSEVFGATKPSPGKKDQDPVESLAVDAARDIEGKKNGKKATKEPITKVQADEVFRQAFNICGRDYDAMRSLVAKVLGKHGLAKTTEIPAHLYEQFMIDLNTAA